MDFTILAVVLLLCGGIPLRVQIKNAGKGIYRLLCLR